MIISDPAEACQFIRQRHDYWYDVLNGWSFLANPAVLIKKPRCGIVPNGRNAAGYYHCRDNRCSYTLPMAMLEPDFDTTIAHEMCHAFQRVIMPESSWHGDFFHYLLNKVCRCPSERCHHYDVNKAKALGEFLILQSELTGCKPWESNGHASNTIGLGD